MAEANKITIRTVEGLPEFDYAGMFSRVFGFVDPFHLPAFTFVGYAGDKPVGFVSMYRRKGNEIYLQYAGVLPEFKGIRTMKLFTQVVKELHEVFHFITVSIESVNIPALKIALAAGFVVNGFHVSSLGVGFVDLLKEKDNGGIS